MKRVSFQNVNNLFNIEFPIRSVHLSESVQSLRSGEKRERASWMRRGMSLILLTCTIILIPLFVHYHSWIPIRSVALTAILALHASNKKNCHHHHLRHIKHSKTSNSSRSCLDINYNISPSYSSSIYSREEYNTLKWRSECIVYGKSVHNR